MSLSHNNNFSWLFFAALSYLRDRGGSSLNTLWMNARAKKVANVNSAGLKFYGPIERGQNCNDNKEIKELL